MSRWTFVAALGWLVGGSYLVFHAWHTPRCQWCRKAWEPQQPTDTAR